MDTTLTDPLVGRVVDERYRVVSRLARGGMATVYEAVDTRLERTVALKVMHASLAEDADFVARFVREARAAARLSHPNVVAVFDQGTDGDLVFLVMEYVPSLNLREVLRDRGALTVQESFDVIEPVLSALSAAHAAGIVHRDVKPENVLLAQDGRVLVADFGLARATTNATSATSGVLIGTVAYLAPEQVERGIADPRSDVYAAGIVLYEMLTGAPPFAGETPLSVAYQHVNGVVPPPSLTVAGLPSAVDALLASATSRDPDERYSDAGRFLEAVRATRARIDLPSWTPAAAATTSPRALTDTLVVPRGVDLDRADRASRSGAADDLDADPAHGTGVLAVDGAASAGGAATSAPRRRRRLRGLVVLAVVLALAVAVGILAFDAGSARYVQAPAVDLLTQNAADAKLQAAGLTPVAGPTVFSETVPKGQVVTTDPAGLTRVKKGSRVVLTVSRGPQRFGAPAVKGLSLAAAKAAVAGASLAVGDVTKQYSDTVPAGDVVSSSVPAGTQLKRGALVDLVVSKGVQPIYVPQVEGSSQAAATTRLRSLGFVVSATSAYSTKVANGVVISQSPGHGYAGRRGDTVALVISKGPPPVVVPNVVGMTVAQATRRLEAAGLKVKAEYLLSFGKPLGVVRNQSSSGATVPRGTTVTIGYV